MPTTWEGLRQALAYGERHFPGLWLRDLDGVDRDLFHCVRRGGCLREARFGHASLAEADGERGSVQRSLFWGADLSGLRACGSFWQEADLSASKLQAADFSDAHQHHTGLRGVLAAGSRWHHARLDEAPYPEGPRPQPEQRRSSGDRKTSACFDAHAMPASHKPVLANGQARGDSKHPPGQSRGAVWRCTANPPGGTHSTGGSL